MTTLISDALLFDMDGVLVDSRAVVERTWRRWARRHGLDAEQLLRVAHGRRTGDTLRAVAPELATPEEIAWLDAAELADFEGLEEVPGAAQLLKSLEKTGWAIVASAGPELARRRLAAAGLPMPPLLVSSADVARGKPAPDGYLLAAERLEVAPARTIVFEDAPPGVAAGRAAGATVIGVTATNPAAELDQADFVVADLTRVAATKLLDGWQVALQT